MRIISIISKELKCVKEDISFNLATLISPLLFLLAFSMIAVTSAGKFIRNKWYELADKRRKIPYIMMFVDMVLPAVLLVFSAMALVGNSYNPFLYFQF